METNYFIVSTLIAAIWVLIYIVSDKNIKNYNKNNVIEYEGGIVQTNKRKKVIYFRIFQIILTYSLTAFVYNQNYIDKNIVIGIILSFAFINLYKVLFYFLQLYEIDKRNITGKVKYNKTTTITSSILNSVIFLILFVILYMLTGSNILLGFIITYGFTLFKNFLHLLKVTK